MGNISEQIEKASFFFRKMCGVEGERLGCYAVAQGNLHQKLGICRWTCAIMQNREGRNDCEINSRIPTGPKEMARGYGRHPAGRNGGFFHQASA